MSETNTPIVEVSDEEAPVDFADKPREPTAYEKKLRAEARQHRQRAQEAERSREEAVRNVRAEADEAIAAVQAAAEQRVVRAELKALAVKSGIVDLDGLRLLDLSGVRLDETGEVHGAEGMIAELKTRKPWLFGATSSSSTAKPPSELPLSTKMVRNMSRDEWRAARADLIKQR
jgi:hypothetical protein